jgi:hypothetical protein
MNNVGKIRVLPKPRVGTPMRWITTFPCQNINKKCPVMSHASGVHEAEPELLVLHQNLGRGSFFGCAKELGREQQPPNRAAKRPR